MKPAAPFSLEDRGRGENLRSPKTAGAPAGGCPSRFFHPSKRSSSLSLRPGEADTPDAGTLSSRAMAPVRNLSLEGRSYASPGPARALSHRLVLRPHRTERHGAEPPSSYLDRELRSRLRPERSIVASARRADLGCGSRLRPERVSWSTLSLGEAVARRPPLVSQYTEARSLR